MKIDKHLIISICALFIAVIASLFSVHYYKQYDTAFVEGMEAGSVETAFIIQDGKNTMADKLNEFYREMKYEIEILPTPTENYAEELEDYAFIDSEERWQ